MKKSETKPLAEAILSGNQEDINKNLENLQKKLSSMSSAELNNLSEALKKATLEMTDEELAEALSKVKAVAVMDKCESFSACGGPVFAETRSALYDLPQRPLAVNYVYGLGGRDVTVNTFEEIFKALEQMAESGQVGEVYRHIGVRDLEEQR